MTTVGLAGRLEDYIRRLDWALRDLPSEDRRNIKAEINSHLAERAAQGSFALDAAVLALGPPDRFARAFVENYELSGAVNRASPTNLLLVMLLHASRSVAAFLIGFAALIFYLFSLAFALMAVLKIITPAHVGAWINDGAVEFGAHYGGPPPGGAELLGYWVIPLAVLLALACYILGTLLLRGGARRMLRRARARTTGLRET